MAIYGPIQSHPDVHVTTHISMAIYGPIQSYPDVHVTTYNT